MNIFRTLVFILYTVSTVAVCKADLPKKLEQNILRAKAECTSFDLVYKRAFKFPMGTDTIFETYYSSLDISDKQPSVGFHVVEWTVSEAYKSMVAVNDSFFYRVNFPAKIFFTLNRKTQERQIQEQLRPSLYHPFTYTADELKSFNKKEETEEVIKIVREDTIKQSKLVNILQKTEIWISKTSYLPVRECVVASNGNYNQYALYELVSIKTRRQADRPDLMRRTDSLIKIIHTYNDADSIKKVRLSRYKDFKPGDTIKWFTGIAGNGDSIRMADIKDSIVLLDFFYSTCKPCLDAIPTLSLIQDSFRNKGVLLFGVNILKSDWKNLKNFNANMKPRYMILRADPDLAYEYNIRQYPRMFILKNGVLMKVIYGYTKGEDKQIMEYIHQLQH